MSVNEVSTTPISAATLSTFPRFRMGRLFITPGALEALDEAKQSPDEFIRRHHRGDWGELCDDDKRENEFSLAHGFRLLSAYSTKLGVRLWVVTEANRSSSTLLLPSEY